MKSPDPPAGTPRQPTKRRRAIQISTLVSCAILLALRRPDALLNPQLWAEDAIVFLMGSASEGAGSLWAPHVGYFHAWPRLLAWLALAFDPALIPAVFAYGAWLVSIGAVAAVLWGRWPGGWTTGLVAALGLTLAPHYSEEVFLTPTNLQWLLAPVLVGLLLVQPPTGRYVAPIAAAVAFLAGMTSPFIVVLAPLIAWRWWSDHARAGSLLYGALMAAAALQAGAILLAGGTSSESDWASLPYYLRVTGFRLGIETFLPESWWPGSAAASIVAGVLVLGVIVGLAARPGPQRQERMMLGVALVGFLITAFYRTRPSVEFLVDPGWGDRYFFSLRVLLIWLLWLGAMDTARRSVRWTALGLLLMTPLASASRYQAPPRTDLRWSDYAPAMRAGHAVDVPIHPMGWTYHHPGRASRQRPGEPNRTP